MRKLFLMALMAAFSVFTWADSPLKTRYGTFAVLGDSYSTFMGFTDPLDNEQWYPHAGNNAASVNQTWWKLFEQQSGVVLEHNNSFSGSTICTHSWGNSTDLVNSFVGRVDNLRRAGLIIVEGATNDNNAGSAIGEYVWENFNASQKRTFRGGTAYVIDYLQKKYPESQIVFMLNNGLRDDINSSVDEICAHYGVPVLKISGVTKVEDHPDAPGMETICSQLIDFLCQLNGYVSLSEDVELSIAEDADAQNLLVGRTLRASKWNGICLPFSLDADQIAGLFGEGTIVETYDSYADNVLHMKKTDRMEAATPYIIMPTREIDLPFTLTADLKSMAPVTLGQGECTMYGCYKPTFVRKGKATSFMIALNGKPCSAKSESFTIPTMGVGFTCSAGADFQIDIEGFGRMDPAVLDNGFFRPLTSNTLHAPATPLITADPFFSIWSETDVLTDDDTRHITGLYHTVRGYVTVDGHPYRFMGTADATVEKSIAADDAVVETAQQTGKTITATQTYYTFKAGGIDLTVVFTAPQLVTDASSLDAAVNYISYRAVANDGQPHTVSVYLAPTDELALRNGSGTTTRTIDNTQGISIGKMGSTVQSLSEGTQANWGYIHLMADADRGQTVVAGASYLLFTDNLGEVTDASGYTVIGRDENALAIGFGYARFPAPWQLHYKTFGDVLTDYAQQVNERIAACRDFDTMLYNDALRSADQRYADLCQIAYRQVVAACKRAQSDSGLTLLYNADAGNSWNINQADQVLAAAPLFLCYNPQLAFDLFEATPDYIAMYPWFSSPYGNAPHDLGAAWPVMAGSNLDTGVEATTALCLLAGAAVKCGVPAMSVSQRSYDYLTSLCDYLDLFTLPQYKNNFPNEGSNDGNGSLISDYANLRIRSALSMAVVAWLASERGATADALKYREMADRWASDFRTSYLSGDHYRQGNGVDWGQKYPLFYDMALGLNVFPDVIETELAYYEGLGGERYGMPLDARSASYAKLHASLLTAALAPEGFSLLVSPAADYVDQTTVARPVMDIYNCQTGEPIAGSGSAALSSLWAKMLIDKLQSGGTAIDRIVSEPSRKAVKGIYDLQGRRLSSSDSLKKGIYIIDGKKVVR